VFEPIHDIFREVRAVASPGPGVGRPAQCRRRRFAGWVLPWRQHQIPGRTRERQPLPQCIGRPDRFGPDREPSGILLRGRQPGIRRGDLPGRQARQGRVSGNGAQHAVRSGVRGVQEKTSGRGHHGQPPPAGHAFELQGRAGWFSRRRCGHIDTGAMPPEEAVRRPGQHGQAVRIIRQGIAEPKTRFAVTTGDQATEIPIPGFVFHQADCPVNGLRVRHLDPDDGPDAVPPAGIQKRPQPVEVVRVGQRQARIAQVFGAAADPGR